MKYWQARFSFARWELVAWTALSVFVGTGIGRWWL